MSPLALILIILFCLVATAFFAGMETGIISIHRMRLKHFVRQGDAMAKVLQGYLDNPDRLLGATLLGTSICIVTISIAAEKLAESMGLDAPWVSGVFSLLAAILVLILGEYIPKAWFHAKPYQRSRRFVRYLQLVEYVFTPIIRGLTAVTERLVPGKTDIHGLAPFVSREDLKMLMREGEEHGVLSAEERQRIQRVFDLRRICVRDVMVPAETMTYVDASLPISEFLAVSQRAPFTRMPVRNDLTDRLESVINLFSAISIPDEERAGKKVADLARKAQTVVETMPLDDVYVLMRRQRQPMCLVVNAEQKVVGLVTDEDVLEEIVGKLSWRHAHRR